MTNIGNMDSAGIHESISVRTINHCDSRISSSVVPIIISFTEQVLVYYLKMSRMDWHIFSKSQKKTMKRLSLQGLLL